jgi:LysM repeat protein
MVSAVSVAASVRADASLRVGGEPPKPGGSHIVTSGETLSSIAHRYQTDVGVLVRLNDIRNPDLVHVGQTLTLPAGAGQRYTIEHGDTLGDIAAKHGVGLKAMLSANPQIDNPSRIYPGDTITIPAGTRSGGTGSGGTTPTHATARTSATAGISQSTRVENGTLSLTDADVTNLKKTLQTEWVQTAGDAQARGIVDTILNRTASGHWGGSVADVVDSYNQFSDINGPIARRDGRNSVEDIPNSRISTRVDTFVDTYLAERASGTPSSIGSHLNYANPNYSSASNLGWINALDGPVLGRGNAVHHHGTVPELERYRPGEVTVALPGTAAADVDANATATGRIDGRTVAAEAGVQVKSDGVHIGRLDAAMSPAIRAVAQAAEKLGLPTPVITSGNDSRHSTASLHYADRALDFRGNNITIEQGRAFQAEVRGILGARYDVVFETFANRSNNHLHVEFDPD